MVSVCAALTTTLTTTSAAFAASAGVSAAATLGHETLDRVRGDVATRDGKAGTAQQVAIPDPISEPSR